MQRVKLLHFLQCTINAISHMSFHHYLIAIEELTDA